MACHKTTRISLVKLRPEIERARALDLWLGAHADVVRELPGVSYYAVDLARDSRASEAWDAVATLQFDSPQHLDDALREPRSREQLMRTREPFVERVDAFVVDHHVVIGGEHS